MARTLNLVKERMVNPMRKGNPMKNNLIVMMTVIEVN